jgi:uncharacterized membrane protein YeaQ/YmgE (transglycosylase-associated protein family)
MSYLWLALVGLVVGAIARFLLPGNQNMGWIMTAVLGMAGSVLSNALGTALGWYKAGETVGWLGSVIGAVVLLILYGLIKNKAVASDVDNKA